MPYDTFLRGEDELSRRMRPVYGSAPDPMSTNSGQTGQEDMARRFARRRLLMGLQGGLGAGVEAGGGFFGNLLRGASGSLGGTIKANQMQHEEERQSISDAAAARTEERLNRSRQEQESAAFENILLGRSRLTEEIRHNKATETGQSGGRMSELEFYLKDPAGYKAYKEAGRTKDETGADIGMEMDEPTLRMTSLMYSKTGQLPAMGMGKGGAQVRSKILNYAAHNFPALDVAANRADQRKNERALTDLQKLYDASTAFEQTAIKNADVMEQAMQGIPDTGTKFGNKAARLLAAQLGDPKVAAFNTALETVKPEFARLLSSPGASGMLTDTARREMQAIIGGDLTIPQMRKSLGILKRDAMNRRQAYSNQIDQIRARLAWNQTGANPNINPAGEGVTAPTTGNSTGDPLDAFYK